MNDEATFHFLEKSIQCIGLAHGHPVHRISQCVVSSYVKNCLFTLLFHWCSRKSEGALLQPSGKLYIACQSVLGVNGFNVWRYAVLYAGLGSTAFELVQNFKLSSFAILFIIIIKYAAYQQVQGLMEDTHVQLMNCRLHLFLSSASSFSSQYLLLFLKSSRSCVLLLSTPFTSIICPSMAS